MLPSVRDLVDRGVGSPVHERLLVSHGLAFLQRTDSLSLSECVRALQGPVQAPSLTLIVPYFVSAVAHYLAILLRRPHRLPTSAEGTPSSFR